MRYSSLENCREVAARCAIFSMVRRRPEFVGTIFASPGATRTCSRDRATLFPPDGFWAVGDGPAEAGFHQAEEGRVAQRTGTRAGSRLTSRLSCALVVTPALGLTMALGILTSSGTLGGKAGGEPTT